MTRRPAPGRFFVSFIPPGRSAPLRTSSGHRGILLAISQDVVVERNSDTDEYIARVADYPHVFLDRQDRELLAFHWHPTGVSPVRYPHLHLSSRIQPLDLGPDVNPLALADAHVPTGPIGLADIVRLAIAEFGVRPRRADWAAILG